MGRAEHLIVFGASGAIGTAVCDQAVSKGWQVTGVSRSAPQSLLKEVRHLALDPFGDGSWVARLREAGPFTSVCWAQGVNVSDCVRTIDRDAHLDVYRANCLYILETLKVMLVDDLLERGARMCVISSIWQALARQNKLSYCMTKAALEGLVLSASADLASDGHLINAVLPGAVDTPMTRKSLTAEQIDRIANGTKFGRLTTLADVASLVCYLCSPENTGITGQFIAADLGWSRVRIV